MVADPTESQVRSWLFEHNNWGRRGGHDDAGTVNLITSSRRRAAIAAVRSAEALSLSRPINTIASANNTEPAQHFVSFWHDGGDGAADGSPPRRREAAGGWAADYYGMSYHGYTTTHLDALCHVWDSAGMYNGRDPRVAMTSGGAAFGGVERWADGLFTRAVLVDIPSYRGAEYVALGSPVHAGEISAALESQGSCLEPGDALCVYMGRDKFDADAADKPYGTEPGPRPGMHASCLPLLRDNDISILGWDMMDALPFEYDVAWTVHGAIWAYGLPILDNMALERLALVCARRQSYAFALMVAPLVMVGGTGSPVNPIALI